MMLGNFGNNEKIVWTVHSKGKMRQYRLSEKRVLRIFRRPERIEEGIAPKTVAAMQITGTKKHPTEVWMMYQIINLKPKTTLRLRSGQENLKPKTIRIISTWRYPGRTPVGARPQIPQDTLDNLSDILNTTNK